MEAQHSVATLILAAVSTSGARSDASAPLVGATAS